MLRMRGPATPATTRPDDSQAIPLSSPSEGDLWTVSVKGAPRAADLKVRAGERSRDFSPTPTVASAANTKDQRMSTRCGGGGLPSAAHGMVVPRLQAGRPMAGCWSGPPLLHLPDANGCHRHYWKARGGALAQAAEAAMRRTAAVCSSQRGTRRQSSHQTVSRGHREISALRRQFGAVPLTADWPNSHNPMFWTHAVTSFRPRRGDDIYSMDRMATPETAHASTGFR